VRAEIRGGRWKKRTCKRCSYFAFARGEITTRSELRKRRDLKRSPCKRCPARGFMER
jgi:hypothetical protein